MKLQYLLITVIALLSVLSPTVAQAQTASAQPSLPWWEIQSIDTMKYSRDRSREYLGNRAVLENTVEEQVAAIAATGVTHISIATPYDDEFLPVLKSWVEEARQYNLKIWFRGNFSGWEGWFGYPRISRQEHLKKTISFIEKNPQLFEDDDIFSACPECENGGPGDPRLTGDTNGHRQFLIDEHQAVGKAFSKLNKKVDTRFNSMNGDVARLIMNPATTTALGGVVVIDHYVRTPEQLNSDINEIAEKSQGKVFLGEMGAPIPDIHGSMSAQQQADWMEKALSLLANNNNVIGLNYWTNRGGSTALWTDSAQPKPAVALLEKYFKPRTVTATLLSNEKPLVGVNVSTPRATFFSNEDGQVVIPYLEETMPLFIYQPSFATQTITIQSLLENPLIELTPLNQSWWQMLIQLIKEWLQ